MSNKRKPKKSRLVRFSIATLALLLVCAAGTGGWIFTRLRASVPRLTGAASVPGLAAEVTIKRDANGVPTLQGHGREDLARATGFLHAQERFFQMDLLRRTAAGELAALLGAVAVSADRAVRLHRFRERARRVLASIAPSDRNLLDTYAQGVNTGLADLGAPPPEYVLLRTNPVPWRPEDSILTVYAMYLRLQDSTGERDSMVGLVYDVLPEALAEFLTPTGTSFDAPLTDHAMVQAGPMVAPDVFDLSIQPSGEGTRRSGSRREPSPDHIPGSNSWAVSGAHTGSASALLANDMHLALAVPNTWYRVCLEDLEGPHRITGVTLPGVPVVVVGSNGRIAWSFTNSRIDSTDLVILETIGPSGDHYQTPTGPEPFASTVETIRVRGDSDVTVTVRETIWGPVVDKDHLGRTRALRWVAHDPRAVNLALLRLEDASSVDEALAVVADAGVPAQNLVVADHRGSIGWTIAGNIPKRRGYDGRRPQSFADGTRAWDGWLAPADFPRVNNPESGRIWTANSRVVGGDMLTRVGDGGYALGARARQIRDALLNVEQASESQMLRIQLDDRALFLERWQRLLLSLLDEGNGRWAEMRRYVHGWSGRADVDSVGYRIVRAFRNEAKRQVLSSLTAACVAADPRFDPVRLSRQAEGPLWQLLTERPAHLLSPRFASWHEQLMDVVRVVHEQATRDGAGFADFTWGHRNTARIQHPFSRFAPVLSQWVDMPRTPLPGDSHMPRVQHPSAGASMRMVVSPGRENRGLMHMPAGQSGHPLAPYFGAGHEAWEHGTETPFLPGPTRYTLRLVPAEV